MHSVLRLRRIQELCVRFSYGLGATQESISMFDNGIYQTLGAWLSPLLPGQGSSLLF